MPNLLAFGADVEAICTSSTGQPVSVCGQFGNKHKPWPLPNGGGIQHDGVLVEWNIPPAFSAEDAVINTAVTQHHVHEYLKDLDLVANYISSATYPINELSHPLAWLIGCNEDYNAWDQGKPNRKPEFVGPERTAGGHAHFSWNRKEKVSASTVHKMVRLMDLYLALPSLFIDTDTFRRSLYGQAGCFRLKDYGSNATGVEYRTLGPWWTDPKHQGTYVEWVFNTGKFIIENVDDLDEPPPIIQEAINRHDMNTAYDLMLNYGIKHV